MQLYCVASLFCVTQAEKKSWPPPGGVGRVVAEGSLHSKCHINLLGLTHNGTQPPAVSVLFGEKEQGFNSPSRPFPSRAFGLLALAAVSEAVPIPPASSGILTMAFKALYTYPLILWNSGPLSSTQHGSTFLLHSLQSLSDILQNCLVFYTHTHPRSRVKSDPRKFL